MQASKFTKLRWLDRQIVPYLQALSSRACTHPIHTIVFIALLASTTYIGLLETSLFEPPISIDTTAGHVDFTALLVGSKLLYLGADTNWKWQNGDHDGQIPVESVCEQPCSFYQARSKFNSDEIQAAQELALMTLVFPDTVSNGAMVSLPEPKSFLLANASTVELLPSSKNLLSPISQETTVAISLSYGSAAEFITLIQELPVDTEENMTAGNNEEKKRWIMSAARGDATSLQRTFRRRSLDAWTALLDLLKVSSLLSGLSNWFP